MRQKSGPVKEPATQVLKNIRRATRRHFSAENKIRIVLEGLRGEDGIADCVVARRSSRTSAIAGRRIFWRPARSAWLRPSQRPER
jgi:transposase-like protein